MNDQEFLKELIARGAGAEEGYFHYAHLVACLFPKNLVEQLRQLVNGPVWDGNVVSKSQRGELFSLGLAVRVCSKGDQGYTAGTYFAFSILKCIDEIRTGQVAA